MSAVNNIIEALGGRPYLKRLGAEVAPQDRVGQVVLRWSKDNARNGLTWCHIVAINGTYSIWAGDRHEATIEESELSLEGLARRFRQLVGELSLAS